MNEVMGKDTARNSLGRPLPSPSNKRNSGLDPSTISAMFPDAAAAIARKKMNTLKLQAMLRPRTATVLLLVIDPLC